MNGAPEFVRLRPASQKRDVGHPISWRCEREYRREYWVGFHAGWGVGRT